MTVFEFTILVWIGSAVAGLLGALTGLGGGVVLVPLLTLFFKVDIRYAIGASLVSVIATSSGAAAAAGVAGIAATAGAGAGALGPAAATVKASVKRSVAMMSRVNNPIFFKCSSSSEFRPGRNR